MSRCSSSKGDSLLSIETKALSLPLPLLPLSFFSVLSRQFVECTGGRYF